MSRKRKPKKEGQPDLSPAMRELVREALKLRGWSAEGIEDLLSSGLLEEPEMRAQAEEALAEAFQAGIRKAGLG